MFVLGCSTPNCSWCGTAEKDKSMYKFKFTVGQAHEFALACARNGVTPQDLKFLSEGQNLSRALDALTRDQGNILNFEGEEWQWDLWDPKGRRIHILEAREVCSQDGWSPATLEQEAAFREQYPFACKANQVTTYRPVSDDFGGSYLPGSKFLRVRRRNS